MRSNTLMKNFVQIMLSSRLLLKMHTKLAVAIITFLLNLLTITMLHLPPLPPFPLLHASLYPNSLMRNANYSGTIAAASSVATFSNPMSPPLAQMIS